MSTIRFLTLFFALVLIGVPHRVFAAPQTTAKPAPVAQVPANPFLVQGIAVDVVGESAVAARAKAFKRAQQKGFDQLAKQVLPPERAAAYKRPPLSVISPMVLDFEVTNERLSDTRYLGTYAIRFSQQKVKRYFGTLSDGLASAPQKAPADQMANNAVNPKAQIPQDVGEISPPLIEKNTQAQQAYVPPPITGPSQIYRVVVGFQNLTEWQEARQTLARIQGMAGIRIASLSSASAILDAQYQGDGRMLYTALEQSGFTIDPVMPARAGERPTVTIRKNNSTLRFLR